MAAAAAVRSVKEARSIAVLRQTTAVLLLSQQPAIPARSAIGSSDGTIILSLWCGNLLASELARRKSSSATSVPDAHRNRTAFALRTPSSAARDSGLRCIWQPYRRELPSEGV